jgi:hypothetical protein
MLDAKLRRNLRATVYIGSSRGSDPALLLLMVSQGITRNTPETSTSFASILYLVPTCAWLPRTPPPSWQVPRSGGRREFCVVGVVDEAGRPQPVLGGPDPLRIRWADSFRLSSASPRIGSFSATLPPAFYQEPRKRSGAY